MVCWRLTLPSKSIALCLCWAVLVFTPLFLLLMTDSVDNECSTLFSPGRCYRYNFFCLQYVHHTYLFFFYFCLFYLLCILLHVPKALQWNHSIRLSVWLAINKEMSPWDDRLVYDMLCWSLPSFTLLTH